MIIANFPAIKHTVSAIEVKMESMAACHANGNEAKTNIAKLPTVVNSTYKCKELQGS